jgi:hypothetical protein
MGKNTIKFLQQCQCIYSNFRVDSPTNQERIKSIAKEVYLTEKNLSRKTAYNTDKGFLYLYRNS